MTAPVAATSAEAPVPVRRAWFASASVWPIALTLLVFAGAALYCQLAGKTYLLAPLARIMIFAIGAVALNLILGYGGLVSFGHALYVGIGVYSVGILDHYGVVNGWLHVGAAIGVSAVIGLLVGMLSLRLSGVYFIMITLAFAQMAFYLFTGLTVYGGDDGMPLSVRSHFLDAIPLKNPYVFHFVCLSVLGITLILMQRIVNSRFGMVIQGARINERRMHALGYPVFQYRLVAYVISGVVCAIAGVLMVNLNQFASSQYLHWVISGDLTVMIIMGGLNSVVGPVLGATAFIVLQEVLSAYTDRWQVVLGPLLVLLVIFAREGLVGLFVKLGALFGRRRGA